jgi:hypothetical protein
MLVGNWVWTAVEDGSSGDRSVLFTKSITTTWMFPGNSVCFSRSSDKHGTRRTRSRQTDRLPNSSSLYLLRKFIASLLLSWYATQRRSPWSNQPPLHSPYIHYVFPSCCSHPHRPILSYCLGVDLQQHSQSRPILQTLHDTSPVRARLFQRARSRPRSRLREGPSR